MEKINVVMFGGLSECGKTHASKFSTKNNFTHVKIIYFEKKIMSSLNIDENSVDSFDKMYQNDHDMIFELFLNEIIKHCEENNIKNISLDSTTRWDMVKFLQNSDKINFISVYIDTEFDNRVNREFEKLAGSKTLEEVKEQTIEKDETKLKRRADAVKDYSIVVTNNGTVEEFDKKIKEILNVAENYNFRQVKNVLFDKPNNYGYEFIDEPSNSQAQLEKISDHFTKTQLLRK